VAIRGKEAFLIPTAPMSCALKFFLELFAKRRKGRRALVVKTGENTILFLTYRKVLVLFALPECVEEEVQMIAVAEP